MNVNQLKKICEKEIAKGNGKAQVYFDTESMCFDTHYVNVSIHSVVPKDILDDKSHFVLHFDARKEKFHYNK
jgi:hypothetical protein